MEYFSHPGDEDYCGMRLVGMSREAHYFMI